MGRILHQVLETVLHGVERVALLRPGEGRHPCLPGSAGLHDVFDRAEDLLVASDGVLDARCSAGETVLLEQRTVGLNCVHGILQLGHFVLKGLQGLFYHGGNAGKQSDVVGNSSQGLDLLHGAKGFEVSRRTVLSVLSILRKGLGLLEEIRYLLSNASFEGIDVVDEGVIDILGASL